MGGRVIGLCCCPFPGLIAVLYLQEILSLREAGWRAFGNSLLSCNFYVSLKLFKNKNNKVPSNVYNI